MEEIKHGNLMSEQDKKTFRSKNNFEGFFCFFFVSAVSGCVSITAFASTVGVLVDITSSAAELRTCSFNCRN